jgi:hypothetical protein
MYEEVIRNGEKNIVEIYANTLSIELAVRMVDSITGVPVTTP